MARGFKVTFSQLYHDLKNDGLDVSVIFHDDRCRLSRDVKKLIVRELLAEKKAEEREVRNEVKA